MDKWFWIYHNIKQKYEGKGIPPLVDRDWEYIKVLLKSLYKRYMPAGDGKFSRIKTWTTDFAWALDRVKKSFVGENDILLAFFLGLSCSFECIGEELKIIEKGL